MCALKYRAMTALSTSMPVPYQAADCLAHRLVGYVPTACGSCTCCSCSRGLQTKVQKQFMNEHSACVNLGGKCLQALLLTAVAMGKPGSEVLAQMLLPHTDGKHPLTDTVLHVRHFRLIRCSIGRSQALEAKYTCPLAGLAHTQQQCE